MLELGTKAETLERLSEVIKMAKVLPQIRTTIDEHHTNNDKVISRIKKSGWIDKPLIVRSSALAEDANTGSFAGHFSSILNVKGELDIKSAIEKVISSFDGLNRQDQVLIQPMLEGVIISGVAFSKNPTSGAPYILINYDNTSGSTTSVTSGSTNELKAYCHYRNSTELPASPIGQVIQLMLELEELFCTDQLDLEFAITNDGALYLLQVRPLVVSNKSPVVSSLHKQALNSIHKKIKSSLAPHPYLFGSRTIYGVMPDWNPAEIIGIRPKPLSLSLYKEMVTDQIWSYQRDNYGYCNLRSFPLLINFHGLPYIDVRVSFNSFIPSKVDTKLAEKLVNYYLDRLEEFPNFHDKIEFEIIYSCYTLDLPSRLELLKSYGFNDKELDSLSFNLRELTNRIIDGEHGLWRSDIEKIDILEKRFHTISSSSLDLISKIYWLIEDCKRYGTLPFAGLARAGFIAIQLLKSLVNVGILSTKEYHQFLESLNTVSSQMTLDIEKMDRDAFLNKYGHLRPGTYDILSPRYDEAPSQYFSWEDKNYTCKAQSQIFQLTLKQIKQIEDLLKKHKLTHNIISFFDFIKAAIEGREYSKFIFSRSLSHVLSLFKELGIENNLPIEDCSFADIACIRQLYASSTETASILRKSIEEGKNAYKITEQIILPPLINSPDQVFSFELPASEPNYITLKRVTAPIAKISDNKEKFKGSILLIPSADPGFDWIFSHKIKGLITMYGGMNSHMAIRAGELGIPAIIGTGEVLYGQLGKAKVVEIDCANRQQRILS